MTECATPWTDDKLYWGPATQPPGPERLVAALRRFSSQAEIDRLRRDIAAVERHQPGQTTGQPWTRFMQI